MNLIAKKNSNQLGIENNMPKIIEKITKSRIPIKEMLNLWASIVPLIKKNMKGESIALVSQIFVA